ncbi:MAG: nitrilase-related carbon-nitrogen hydrolase, partial [Chloroflexota bacterium]|nr:nitrilase-related carbon-nitrogen hydrolase [Chloroflexota bacterium]
TAMGFIHPLAEPVFFIVFVVPLSLVPYVVDRLYYRRWAKEGNAAFWLTFVFPVSVTAIDFFSASGSPFGSFGAAAYSQTGFTALMQLTAITGMWGIPFIVSWFASVVNYVWENDFQWTKVSRGVLIFTGMLVLIFGFGFGRMALAAPPQHDVQIGGFSLPEEGVVSMIALWQGDEEAAFREAVREQNAHQLVQVRVLAQEGADIVVLQEGAGMGFAEEVDALLTSATSMAQEEGIFLVLPTVTLDPTGENPFHNVVRIIDPNGDVVLEHYKYGGTQFEGSVTGDGELQTVETPYGKLSAVICWDADFPATVRQAGEQDVDLLFIPANDWYEIRDIHAGMAIFRSVENGLPIFRQTGDGVSVVTDAYGRMINRVDMFEEESIGPWGGEQMVIAPVGSIETLYPKIGDAFGWAMLVGLFGLLVVAWIKRE